MSNFSVGIFSSRAIERNVAHFCGYEFEDVIAALSGGEILTPEHGAFRLPNAYATNRVAGWSNRILSNDIRYKFSPPGRNYDLLFVRVQNPYDLYSLGSYKNWRKSAGLAVVWIEEIWLSMVDRLGFSRQILDQFDLVITGCVGVLEALQRELDTNVVYFPPGVDAIVFGRHARKWSDRSVRVCNFGRRSSVAHADLMRRARETAIFTFTTRILWASEGRG